MPFCSIFLKYFVHNCHIFFLHQKNIKYHDMMNSACTHKKKYWCSIFNFCSFSLNCSFFGLDYPLLIKSFFLKILLYLPFFYIRTYNKWFQSLIKKYNVLLKKNYQEKPLDMLLLVYIARDK